MPGRPKNGRKSQVYKQKMINLAKGIVEEKKEESKLSEVKKIFKDK